MPSRERLLTVVEVVRQIGLSERTVRGLIATGRLRAVRPFGLRAVRVPESALEEIRSIMRAPSRPLAGTRGPDRKRAAH
jgi:excisionase family DNA binding protein